MVACEETVAEIRHRGVRKHFLVNSPPIAHGHAREMVYFLELLYATNDLELLDVEGAGVDDALHNKPITAANGSDVIARM